MKKKIKNITQEKAYQELLKDVVNLVKATKGAKRPYKTTWFGEENKFKK